jgi:RNA-directed DNA polymerase
MSGRSGLRLRRRRRRCREESAETIVLRNAKASPTAEGRVESTNARSSPEDSTNVKRQQSASYQLDLFGARENDVRRGVLGEGGTRSEATEERQAFAALEEQRALTGSAIKPTDLMWRVCDPANLNRAYKRVKANGGAPGIDGMRTTELRAWLIEHGEELSAALMSGTYRPQPVKGVQIPKPGGGMRQLGIPTVTDRLVQQAILQVLEPMLDPTFSQHSYGFRPGRNAHKALRAAQKFVAEGKVIVVDLDLEKFFDRVNHDVLMARLARRIDDKALLRTVRRFLEAGMMTEGVHVERYEGTPQGGPLSPLLANLLLDDLDKELERRGHAFCRYADDVNIYVRSHAAGRRVMESITRFLEKRLRLRVNREKSAVAYMQERSFLGYRLLRGGGLGIAPKSMERLKARIRQITRRNRGVSLERMIQELNAFLPGWLEYFKLAAMRGHLQRLEEWIRRKLRCVRLKHCKRPYTIAQFLQANGVPEWRSWLIAGSGKGWWRMAGSPQATEAMPIRWFTEHGLYALVAHYQKLERL